MIRLAHEGDAAAIAAIYAPNVERKPASFELVAPDAAQMAARIRSVLERWPWLVLEEGGAVLGYCYAGAYAERAAYQWSATVSVYLKDNGGGTDTSAPATFTITITAVNDTPSFTSGGNVTVNEDSGPYGAAWASALSTGPADEVAQTLTFNVSNSTYADTSLGLMILMSVSLSATALCSRPIASVSVNC